MFRQGGLRLSVIMKRSHDVSSTSTMTPPGEPQELNYLARCHQRNPSRARDQTFRVTHGYRDLHTHRQHDVPSSQMRFQWSNPRHHLPVKGNRNTMHSSHDQSDALQGANWNNFYHRPKNRQLGFDSCDRYKCSTSSSSNAIAKPLSKHRSDTLPPSEESNVTPQFSAAGNLGRKWISVCHEQNARQNGFKFSVLSYNLLADQLLHDNPFLYTECEDQDSLQWDYRKENLLQELKSYNADIMCLQEVQVNHFHDWFQPHLNRAGYRALYKQRSGSKCDGCAIFFKSSKFRVVRTHVMEFTKPGVPLMDRNNVATIAVLEPRAKWYSGPPICVANTHLLFNKKRGDIKLAQLAYLLAEIDKFAKMDKRKDTSVARRKQPNYVPMILCGDFNSLPFSPLYDLIVKGRLNFRGQSRVKISGQSDAKASPNTIFGNWLLPPELNISHSCRWKPADVIDLCDSDEAACSLSEKQASSDECIILDCPVDATENRSQSKQSRNNDRFRSNISRNHTTTNSVVPHQTSSCESISQKQTMSSSRSPTNFENQLPDHGNESPLSIRPFPDYVVATGEPSGAHSINTDASSAKNASLKERQAYGGHNEEPGVLKHAFDLKSVYSHIHPDASREVTTCHARAAYTVDYVFYSSKSGHPSTQTPNCKHDDHLELLGYLDLLRDEQLYKMGGLPNRFLSSDHVALLALFNLK